MEKIIICTLETCSRCTELKAELVKNNIKFEERLTHEHQEEFNKIVNLTMLPTAPIIYYKNNYFISNRDFNNPQGLINLLKNFKESEFSLSHRNNEAIKTLNYNTAIAFQRMDNILKQIETNTKKEENNEHKSTD